MRDVSPLDDLRVQALDVFTFRLPLVRPLALSTGTLHERSGAVVHLVSGSGEEGWGEVAPLPGFSAERLEDALAALAVLRKTLPAPWPLVAASLAAAPPSVQFGVEQAAWQASTGVSLAPSILGEPRPAVTLNALLVDGDLAEQARALVARGYQSLKLKVGRRASAEDIVRIQSVLQALPATARLRLDANRAWTLREARLVLQAIDLERIDYIEEPLSVPDQLEVLADEGVPVALDESIHEGRVARLSQASVAQSVVIKPTLLGLARTRALLDEAQALGRTVTLSSSFESGLGLSMLYALAATHPAADTPAGLDTYGWLADDLLHPRPALYGPRVQRDAWEAVTLNRAHLRPHPGPS